MRSFALAIALAAAGTTLAPAAAMAAPVAPAAVTMPAAVNTSNIDPTTQTSLAIHKYLGAPTGQPANGTAQTVSLPPLSGVNFDIYQVAGVDLTTNAGWAAATDLQGVSLTTNNVTSGTITGKSGKVYTLTKVTTVTTDTTGTATFKPAAGSFDGLYLGAENLSTSTNISDGTKTYPASSITPAAPFLATLPMTNPGGDAWMYDVNVYPKNATNSITKTVTDKGTISTAGTTTTNADHTLNYTLTGTITPGMTGTQMGSYVIADQLPTGVTYDQVVSVTTTGTSGATLVAGTDYTVTNTNGLVQVAMTATGLDKVAAAKAGDATATVVVDLQVIANAAAGDLNNTANLIPSNAWWQAATGNPTATYNPTTDTPTTDDQTPGKTVTPIVSNEVDTHLGTATLTKTDASDANKPLAGAVFDLYSAVIPRADMNNPSAADCANIVTTATDKVMTGLTTDASGQLTMSGLQQSDYWNSTTQTTDKIVYCLVETKAPTGYNLNAEPTAFFMQNTGTAPAINVTAAVSVQDELNNLSNSLPLTGGAGAAVLSVGGLVVVGATLAARAASRKRREDDDAELD